jgi:hypothetical protein
MDLAGLINSTAFKAAASGLVAVAGAVVTLTPPHTIAFRVATGIISAGALLGIHSQGSGERQP